MVVPVRLKGQTLGFFLGFFLCRCITSLLDWITLSRRLPLTILTPPGGCRAYNTCTMPGNIASASALLPELAWRNDFSGAVSRTLQQVLVAGHQKLRVCRFSQAEQM